MHVERQLYANGNVRLERHYLNYRYHREDGPAIIYYDINGNVKTQQYFINDEVVDIEQYQNITTNQLVELINSCENIDDILTLKLITNIQFKNEVDLLDLIEAKITMLKLL